MVVDVCHHDGYTVPRGILPQCARIVRDLPVLFVGVRCPLAVVMERRRATGWDQGDPDALIQAAVLRWQTAVHQPGIYDLEVDTGLLTPAACAAAICQHLALGLSAISCARLAALAAG